MQTLGDCLKEIREDASISTLNEANAKRRIIERILSLLGWDIYGPEIEAEYGVGERRVDYALQINGENKVFLEAKKPGENLDNHQKQLLDYSFERGVKLAILTNGISWWFYLSLKECDWKDRRFDILDISKQEIRHIAGEFDLLLSRQNVGSGKAVQHAESILDRRQKEKIFRESMPKAWNRIIEDSGNGSSLLVELIKETTEDIIKETTEDICGLKLQENDVGEISQFIRLHQEKWILIPEPQKMDSSIKTSNAKTQVQIKSKPSKPQWMEIDGVHYELTRVYEILINTANWLIDKGNLKSSDCPIKVAGSRKRVLIDQKPTHPSGREFFTEHRLKNDLYIECHASCKYAISHAKKLLEKYGYDPEKLRVDN